MSIIRSITLAFVLMLFLPGPYHGHTSTRNPGAMLAESDSCRRALYESPSRMKYRHNWERCIGGYERLAGMHPESDQAAWALYHAARMYRDMYKVSGRNSDIEESLRLFLLVAERHGEHRLADDGLFWAGEIFQFNKNSPEKAYQHYLKVIHRHPDGDMVPRAERRIKEMGKKITEPAAVVSDGAPVSFVSSREAGRLLETADSCHRQVMSSPERRKFRHNWQRCIDAYEKIVRDFPDTDEAVRARARLGDLHRSLFRVSGRAADLDEAVRWYRDVVENYRGHPEAEDAQFEIASIIYHHKDSPTRAYVEFLKVEIMFPSGSRRSEARNMLDQLSVALRDPSAGPVGTTGAEPASSRTASLRNIRHWSTPNYTRVVVDMDFPVRYRHNLLEADPDHGMPARIYIDLDQAVVSKDIDSAVAIKDGLLQRARAGQFNPDTVRVVLDSELVGEYNVFHLHDPFRIVVDVHRSSQVKAASPAEPREPRPVRRGVRRAEMPDKAMSLARQLGLSVKRVVIDPGHGGKDPGCSLPGGIYEKDIVLSVSKILAEIIRERLGWEVFLTREGDEFISLERRTAIANMHKADLFLSLHINAHKDPRISGIETYFLNMATDENAVMVAARENATSEKNISDLQTILNELMMNTKIEESSRLALSVQEGLVGHVRTKYKDVKSLGVKQAPFYVLIGAEMPSVLLELGFLTNGTEKKRLTNKAYQRKLAEGISVGLEDYMTSINQMFGG